MYEELDEQWSLYSIIKYVSENLIGITLLILAFFIIYIVDHINQLNAIINIPQISSPQILNPMKMKSKKLKKR